MIAAQHPAPTGAAALRPRYRTMLSTPHKRFSWSRGDRAGGFSFFGMMIKRRRARPRIRIKEKGEGRRWKPAPWTPWLWVK